MASVTKVDLTRDLKFAKVHVSIYDTPEKRKSTIEALQHAEGFIKMKVGEAVKIRSLPHLTFLLDDSVEYSLKISKILDGLGVSPQNADNE
jgi:ribosome-binding factor A